MQTTLTAVNAYGHIIAERDVTITVNRRPIAISKNFNNTILDFYRKLDLTGSKISEVYFTLPSRMNEEKFLR